MSEREPDEFDRIVEGLELATPDDEEFRALEDAETVEFEPSDGDLDLVDLPSEDLPDFIEVTYREAPPAAQSGNPWRLRGWIALAMYPFLLMIFSAAGVYLAPSFIGLTVVAAVALLGYLLWTNPSRRSNDYPRDDGSSI